MTASWRYDQSSTRADLDEAVLVVEDVIQRSQRVCGAAHPDTQNMRDLLQALKTERNLRADAEWRRAQDIY